MRYQYFIEVMTLQELCTRTGSFNTFYLKSDTLFCSDFNRYNVYLLSFIMDPSFFIIILSFYSRKIRHVLPIFIRALSSVG